MWSASFSTPTSSRPWNTCAGATARPGSRPSSAWTCVGWDAFTSSVLYSMFLDHAVLAALGQAGAVARGVPFLYRDFRVHWDEGVALSREWGIYRQPYCGCVLSELDRYARKLRRPPEVE